MQPSVRFPVTLNQIWNQSLSFMAEIGFLPKPG